MISFLSAELTTIPHPEDAPRRLARIGTVAGTEVTIPYLGKRSAKTQVSMRSKAAEAIMALEDPALAALGIALKVRYCTPAGRKLAFWGPSLEPVFDYDNGVIEIAAIGPEDRLAAAYVVNGDVAISPGLRLDGHGYRELLAMGQNRPNQDALNWASLGIVPGLDTATPSDDFATLTRGDEIWTQGFVAFGQSAGTPDFEIEPIETDPTSIALGAATDGVDHPCPDVIQSFDLDVALAGEIGKLRVGIYLEATRPRWMEVELVHPDSTWITLWSGAVPNDDPTGGDFLGRGAADGDLCFFADKGDPLYGTLLNPVTYPRVGQFFAVDAPPSANFEGKDASGTWTLRVRTHVGDATLHAWTLRFEQPEPAYARMNTFDKPDTDAPDIKAVFHKGFGKGNAKRLNVTPMGSSVRNEAVEISHSGDSIVRQNGPARLKAGTRQSWESSGQDDTVAILRRKADRIVKAYALPPLTLDLQPADDHGQEGLPRLLFDYKVGEHIEGHAKRDKCHHEVVARVNSATLRQLAGAVETTADVVPTVSASADIADGEAL